MDISPIQPRTNAAEVPLEHLAGNSRLSEGQKIAEATRQFEAILLRQILESARKSVIHSRFTDDSTAASIYHDLVSSQLADSISKSGTLGLAKSLERQLTRQLHPAANAGSDLQPEPRTTPPLKPGSPAGGVVALPSHE
jgi:peptidoglycan hydrolase FlgJ